MSFKLGGSLDSFGRHQILDQAINTRPFAAQTTTQKYEGGSLAVAIKSSDTQQQFVWRGLYEHARAAELDDKQAKEFANHWIKPNTSFNHRAGGKSEPCTDAEFNNLKTKGKAAFELTKEFDAHILADLNQRVEDNAPLQGGEAWAEMTPENRARQQQQNAKGIAQNKAGILDKPIKTIVSAQTEDGKPLTENQALSRYVDRNYNQDKRVWGDKINEIIEQAKLQGVKVELQPSEDGQTALVSVSAADKQKLDRLFNQALSETIKGEEASKKGQQEATNQVTDIGRMYANGAINTVNHITEPFRGVMEVAGVDTSAAKLPKLEYQSEYGKKNGGAGEMGTEIGLVALSAPAALKTTVGKVISGASGVYNVATGAAGVDPTEKDANGNARQMGTLERGVRIIGGAAEVFGARPEFKAESATGKTAAKEAEETIEALTPDGQLVRVKVPTENKPLQTADDLVSEMRGRGGYESNEIKSRVGTKIPRVEQPIEVAPSLKPNAANKPFGEAERIPSGADARQIRGITRQNEAAEVLAQNGYKVEHKPQLTNTDRMSNPWLKAEKKPDLKVEGEIFDVYSPDRGTNIGGIRSGIKDKVVKGQTRRVVLNMDDSAVKLDELKDLIWHEPVVELEQIIVVKDGKITNFFPIKK